MKWPKQLILIRHGESAFNAMKLRRDADPEYQRFKRLYEEGAQKGDFDFPKFTLTLAHKLKQRYALGLSDAETPLTPRGHEQARLTGKGLAQNLPKPDVIFVSPYIRTHQTFEGIMRGHGDLGEVRIVPDERIRERNIGLLELFNDWKVLNALYPEQGQLHRLQGPFYYRYPQGESIVDVQSRNRQWFQTLTRDFRGKVVWAVTHHLTILSIRSLLERWTPEQFVDADQNHTPRNCSLTVYRGDPKQGANGKLVLERYNEIFY
jgi:broad specificity phosphatase PhoE